MDALIASYSRTKECRAAAELIASGRGRVHGFWGGSLAFFLAAWERDLRSRDGAALGLVVAPSQEIADEILEDLEVFAPGRAQAFSPWESLFLDSSEPDPLILAERLGALELLRRRRDERSFLVAPVQALLQPVPPPPTLDACLIPIVRGEDLSRDDLAAILAGKGYRNVALVERAGEFSCRGDIFDVFAHGAPHPMRFEFFGDTIDSIRRFSPASQRSVPDSTVGRHTLSLPSVEELFVDLYRGKEMLLLDYLDGNDRLLLFEPEEIASRIDRIYHHVESEEADAWRDSFRGKLEARTSATLSVLPPASSEEPSVALGLGSVEGVREKEGEGALHSLRDHLASGQSIRLYCDTSGEAKRVGEILEEDEITPVHLDPARDAGDPAPKAASPKAASPKAASGGERPRVELAIGSLRRGFELRALRTSVLTTREVFQRRVLRRPKRRVEEGRALQSFLELEQGDHVVHLIHGIGRYLGIEVIEKDGIDQEFLSLQYRGDARVYVPVSKIDLVQKYIGSGDKAPILDKIGGTSWAKKKEAVESALADMAADLLEVQSQRATRPGLAYPPDSDWQREFEASFPFEDTPDQVDITEALKADMMSARPMDRLICGDVGYGKTELAMRAAFKAIEGKKQVAVLVPTTLLAEQHHRTFRERMAEFPVTVEVLSRFRTKAEQRDVVKRARRGAVDILIGTHRILSKDVEFADLGLVIIDEEQRFGVKHKERLKKLRSVVDVLTLTATPIPRTLHMSLLGIRDISSLTTAPEGRAPIHTEICRFDSKLIREIIVRELNRDGQVYFVHNRVKDIEIIQREIEMAVPEARVVVAHGQMHEDDLEERMLGFLGGKFDVLLATTIIESGIDIPTANTMLINEADRYGLADMHQLRGRVGRSRHQAYCYLVLPTRRHVQEDARKRMKALVEFSGLGAGFQIAMRDLEIRGAGNILGKEQSGHIATVGYDLYCRLLEKCVRRLKKEEYSEPVSVEIDLAMDAFLPDEFLSDHGAKLEVYRRVSTVKDPSAIEDLRVELTDRFGRLPQELVRLLELHELRARCSLQGVEYVGRDGHNLLLRGRESMQTLLATCPRRVIVLDARTVAVRLAERGDTSGPWDDGRVFEIVSRWLRDGVFPEERPRSKPGGRRRFVDISPEADRVDCSQ